MKTCPECGKNEFYLIESTIWGASFDEEGTLQCNDGEAGGIDKVTCICGHDLSVEKLGEVNFN